jgi:hypothetical protein
VAKGTPKGTHALKKAAPVDRKRITLSPSPNLPFPSSQTVFFAAAYSSMLKIMPACSPEMFMLIYKTICHHTL